MDLTKNIVSFRKGFLVAPNDHADNRIDVATCNAELMKFGYMLTEEAFGQLSRADTSFIRDYTTEISKHLTSLMGDGDWKPLHAGFPTTVMNMSILDYYMHAIMHYWTDGEYIPNQEVIDEGYTYEYIEYKFIDAGTEKDHMSIFTTLTSVGNSIAPPDMQTIEWFADTYEFKALEEYMPMSIPFKENLTVLAAKGIPVPVKHPTDVLRIAHYISHKHTDLFIPPRQIKNSGWKKGMSANPEYKSRHFKSFSHTERGYILSLLEQCASPMEMVRYRMQWIKLGERLHPGDSPFKEAFPRSLAAFDKLRNGKVRSWYGWRDMAFKKSYREGVTKLMERPGEFARLLDATFRKANKKDRAFVISSFKSVGTRVSGKVLWELYTHFQERNIQKARSVWIKGARKPTPLKTLKAMKQEDVDIILELIWAIFFDKFALLDPLGAVWMDEDLKKIPAPTNMRTLSEGLVTVVRGQRNPIKADKKVLRCYCHWTERQDLDLSVDFVTKDGKKRDHCGFNHHPSYGVYSSGDIIPHSIGKHAEYVDIVLDKIPFDYALMVVNNYSGYAMNTANAIMGFMERDTHTSGGDKTWLPATVTNAIKIQSSAIRVAVILIDLNTKEWILVDEDLKGIPVSNGSAIFGIVKRVAELPAVSVYDILKIHIEARGKLVLEPDDADIIYKFEDFNTSYEEVLKYML